MIYFVLADHLNVVKIGFTSGDPKKRFQSFRTGCPDHLELIGWLPGDEGEEREWHRWFRDDHFRGEWFNVTPELIQMVVQWEGFKGRWPSIWSFIDRYGYYRGGLRGLSVHHIPSERTFDVAGTWWGRNQKLMLVTDRTPDAERDADYLANAARKLGADSDAYREVVYSLKTLHLKRCSYITPKHHDPSVEASECAFLDRWMTRRHSGIL